MLWFHDQIAKTFPTCAAAFLTGHSCGFSDQSNDFQIGAILDWAAPWAETHICPFAPNTGLGLRQIWFVNLLPSNGSIQSRMTRDLALQSTGKGEVDRHERPRAAVHEWSQSSSAVFPKKTFHSRTALLLLGAMPLGKYEAIDIICECSLRKGVEVGSC